MSADAPMSSVSTHVLDAVSGAPAAGVAVRLERQPGGTLAEATTDADGRIARLGDPDLAPGTYRLTFATGDYFAALGRPTFYPQIQISFTVGEPGQHYHVPVLLSPFAYSTYRGS
jgi:5-hydroxyisourate hydrolase